jgi:hypothetical protein
MKTAFRILLAVLLAAGCITTAHAIGDSGGCGDPLSGPLGRALKGGTPQDVESAINTWIDAKQSSAGIVASLAQRARKVGGEQGWRRQQTLNLIEGKHEKDASCVPGPLLTVALLAGNVDVVQFLLNRPLGVEPRVPPGILFSCNDAVEIGAQRASRREAFARILDTKTVDLNESNDRGRTLLLVCRDPQLLALFLERGARLDLQSENRFDPLDAAIRDAVSTQEGSYTALRMYAVERARLFAKLISGSIRGRSVEAHARYSCNLVVHGQRWNPTTCHELSTFIKAAPGTFGE